MCWHLANASVRHRTEKRRKKSSLMCETGKFHKFWHYNYQTVLQTKLDRSYWLLNSGVYVCVRACLWACAFHLGVCVLPCMCARVWSNKPEASIPAFQCFPHSCRHLHCPKHFSYPPAPPEMGKKRDIYTWFLAFVGTSVKKAVGDGVMEPARPNNACWPTLKCHHVYRPIISFEQMTAKC